MDEILKRDENHVTVIGAITDDENQQVRMLRVDPTTNRVLVSITGAGAGDVVGPASATDNAIARFDGTTGELIQNSGVTIDDSDNVLGIASLGATGTRLTKGWFTDLEVTNAIEGDITGNAGTVTTITGLAPDTATTQATQPNITSAANLVTVGTLSSGNATAIVDASSLTVAGKVELATVAETNTGTDDTRAITPAGLAGSTLQSTADSAMQDLVDDTTPTLGGELDAGAHSIGFTMQTATGDGTTTIDWKLGNHMDFTFGAFNETFTFTAPTKPGVYTLSLKQDSTGSRTATFPASVKWAGGTAPTLTTTATTGYDIISFRYDGTNYYGVASLNFS